MRIHGSMPASYTGAQSAPDFSNSRKDSGGSGSSSQSSDDKGKDSPQSQDDGTMSGAKVTAFILLIVFVALTALSTAGAVGIFALGVYYEDIERQKEI